jgi:hypothetical protein
VTPDLRLLPTQQMDSIRTLRWTRCGSVRGAAPVPVFREHSVNYRRMARDSGSRRHAPGGGAGGVWPGEAKSDQTEDIDAGGEGTRLHSTE